MTETQKGIAAKMLDEILEEKSFEVRTLRVDEYRTFMVACAVR